MDSQKIEEARAIYENYLKEMNIPSQNHPLDQLAISNNAVLAHCHKKLEEMKELLAQGRREKAMRWLSFVQGCLFTLRHYTIEDIKNHNRPDQEDK